MSPSSRVGYIVYTGDDSDDLAFAKMLKARLDGAGPFRLFDIDHAERDPTFRGQRSAGGRCIYVLSRRLLENELRRERLVASSRSRNFPGRFIAYICRGQSSDSIRRDYPDLQALFRDVMLAEEQHVDLLVEELTKHCPNRTGDLNALARVGYLISFLASLTVALLADCILWLCNPTGLIAGAVLWYLLLSNSDAGAELPIAWGLAACAGVTLNRTPTLDLHPWLGQFEYSKKAPPTSAVQDWVNFVWMWRLIGLARVELLVVPALAVLMDAPFHHRMVGAFLLLAGSVFPAAAYASSRLITRQAYLAIGMTQGELERFENDRFTRRLQRMPVYSSARARRRWLRAPDRVFISYARKDEAQRPVALPFAEMLRWARIPHFLDKRNIPSPFAAWRSAVATEILQCSHFIVILGPEVLEAAADFGEPGIVGDEVTTALHRWETEVVPSILCVVTPSVAEEFQRRSLCQWQLNHVLKHCPCLHPEDLTDLQRVRDVIERYRYQGLLRDLRTLLWPRAALRAAFAPGDLLARSVQLSRAGEWMLMLVLFLLVIGAMNIARPSPAVFDGRMGLFWTAEGEGATTRFERTSVENESEVVVLRIETTAPTSVVRFSHFPNRPLVSRYATLKLRARTESLAASSLSLRLRTATSGDERPAAFRLVDYPCPEPVEPSGWLCAEIPTRTLAPDGRNISSIDLEVSRDSLSGSTWIRELRPNAASTDSANLSGLF